MAVGRRSLATHTVLTLISESSEFKCTNINRVSEVEAGHSKTRLNHCNNACVALVLAALRMVRSSAVLAAEQSTSACWHNRRIQCISIYLYIYILVPWSHHRYSLLIWSWKAHPVGAATTPACLVSKETTETACSLPVWTAQEAMRNMHLRGDHLTSDSHSITPSSDYFTIFTISSPLYFEAPYGYRG